jgi:hypothetical protein
MTNRRKSSPYPHQPSQFTRRLMRAGWRRYDAEGVDLVRRALDHADDPAVVREWARRAADALDRGPVLAGAIHRLDEEAG